MYEYMYLCMKECHECMYTCMYKCISCIIIRTTVKCISDHPRIIKPREVLLRNESAIYLQKPLTSFDLTLSPMAVSPVASCR